jgi:hypothetical protein
VCEVEEASCVERRVWCVRWESEGEARGYEAVEGCVVGSVGEMISIFNPSRQVKRTYLVAVLISPDSEKGSLVASFSSTSSRATGSCFSSISSFSRRTSSGINKKLFGA